MKRLNKIRALITENELRMYDVANAMGISRTMLTYYLNGTSVLPLNRIHELMKLLSIPDSEMGKYFGRES